MSGSVKDLIRNIRVSKTSSEERAVLAKECAKIRSSLNSDSLSSRRKNISKLLFINLLGHPTNFGQVECIKLIASSKFSDKRTGYLALNLLLNEDTEVLMLATNSIKIDLNDPNPYVREMALRALANVGTNEMLRELQYEIEVNMAHNVPNIRKKASVCTVRLLRKEAHRNLTPDSISVGLARSYLKYVDPLVSDYDNGVKLAGLSLMSVILEHYTEVCDLDHLFQLLINTLSQTVNQNQTNFTATIPSTSNTFTQQNLFADQLSDDPFLKIKLLKQLKRVYLKLVSHKSHSISNESLNNGLMQDVDEFDMKSVGYKQKLYEIVSTIMNSFKFDCNKNYAILLECVSTIDCEFANEKFNELGNQIVKKFMSGKDNNVKYLALGIIMKLHNVNMVLGDTNWTIIVQSLKQPDMAIRKKALEVSLKVVNSAILDPLLNYLYEYLLSADEDTKKESMYNIFNCVKIHSNDVAYKLKVFVKIFTIAGNSVQDINLFEFIDLLVSSTDDVKRNTTLELLKVLRYNMAQSALVKASLYSLGEYYQLLSKADLTSVFNSYKPPSARSTPANNLGNLNGYNNYGYNNNSYNVPPVNNPNNQTKPPMNAENSVDLLLDLSTPTNRNTQNSRRDYGTIYETTEDDLLLDVFSPDNSTNNAVNTKDDGMFDLYDVGSSNPNVPAHMIIQESHNVVSMDASIDQDCDALLVELVENVTLRLLTKNMLNECEYLITCVAKLSYKMPKKLDSFRKVLKRFRRHTNPELQQRSCELEIMFKENIVSLVNTGDKPLSELYNEDELVPKSGHHSDVDDLLNVLVRKPETKKDAYSKPDNKVDDIFDEFFSSTDNMANTHSYASNSAHAVDLGTERDPFNMDKLASSIAQNVSVVSSRENKEDDFQQFDPF